MKVQTWFCYEINWDEAPKIIDPYLTAICSRSDSGVIMNRRIFFLLRNNFVFYSMRDSVILEMHMHDLLKNAPMCLRLEQRLELNGVSK
jgi:hypothetical protein